MIKYYIFLFIAPVLWGLNFFLGKYMLQFSNNVEVGVWRYLLGVFALFVIIVKNRPTLALFFKHIKAFALVGGVGLFLFNFFFFLSLQYSNLVNAGLITGLNPALTLLLSYFILQQTILKVHIFGIILAFIGVVFLLFKGDFSSIGSFNFEIGDIFMFIANIFFAFHHIWVKKYGGRMPNTHFTFYSNMVCLLGFLCVLPFYGTGEIGDYPTNYWWIAICIGFFGTAGAYYCWNLGIKHLGAAQGGIFMNMVPLSTAFIAYFLGETLELYHFVSAALIIGGVVIMQGQNLINLKSKSV